MYDCMRKSQAQGSFKNVIIRSVIFVKFDLMLITTVSNSILREGTQLMWQRGDNPRCRLFLVYLGGSHNFI